ncbi:hypothetical protein SAY86_002360 [Trapa natans]|nr:hypothetical protein SAY86_002360 [Trapa natans]
MSIHIDLVEDLPKLRLGAVSYALPPEFTFSVPSVTVVRPDDEEECRTPTSEENRIPAVLTCPLAPKKLRYALSCKRKLEYFDFLNHAKVDEFFLPETTERFVSDELPKRTRLCKRIIA